MTGTQRKYDPPDLVPEKSLEQKREEERQSQSAYLEAHLAKLEQRKAEGRAEFMEACRRQHEPDRNHPGNPVGWDELLNAGEAPERAFNRHVDTILDEVHALARIGPWPHGTTEAERLGDAIDAIYGLLTDPTDGGAA